MNINQERRKLLERELSRIVGMLKRGYRPEKILLFGSLASGRTSRWSDIDLVIIKQTKKRFLQRLKEVALLTKPQVGVDFFVYTSSEFEEMTRQPASFQHLEMLRKGKVLYDRR